jgi:hypothetical protein
MKPLIRLMSLLGVFGLLLWLGGCASCPTCQAAEWQAVASEQAPPPPPAPNPAKDFATPPTDAPATPPAPAPSTPNASTPTAPTPAPSVPATNGTFKKQVEAQGVGIVIEANSGTIVLNSPGVGTPAPASAARPALDQAPTASDGALAVILAPAVEQASQGILKRLGGGLYYAVTGQCPPKPAATTSVTPAASATALVPVQSYAQVPVQTVALTAHVATAPQPTPGYYLLPATPAAAPAAPVLATPQAPRKGLFSKCFSK